MMRKLILPALLLLSGCMTPQQIEAQKQQQCINMGAPPGSPNYYDCRKTLDQKEAANDAKFRESIARYQQQQQQYYRQSPSTSVNCVSSPTGNGGFVTNCN